MTPEQRVKLIQDRMLEIGKPKNHNARKLIVLQRKLHRHQREATKILIEIGKLKSDFSLTPSR